jgi:hypothetical protein
MKAIEVNHEETTLLFIALYDLQNKFKDSKAHTTDATLHEYYSQKLQATARIIEKLKNNPTPTPSTNNLIEKL